MVEKLFTIKETAVMMAVSVKTLYNLRSAGIIPKYKRYTESFVKELQEKYMKGELVV